MERVVRWHAFAGNSGLYFQSGVRYISDAGGVRNYLTIYTLSSEEAVRTPEFAKARGWGRFKEKVRYSTRLYVRLESTHE